jgi:hypothetical protein
MMKRKGRKRRKLKVRISFEPGRLSRAALEDAYERLAPANGRRSKDGEALAKASGMGD